MPGGTEPLVMTPALMAPLRDLQTTLEQIYALAPVPDIRRFLVTDRHLAVHLGAVADDLDEALLVLERDGELNLSLFLDAAVLAQVAGGAVDADNLGAWLLATEGVSHFVYLAARAEVNRPVSQLEMELQGEIDKFVVVEQLLQGQGVSVPDTALLHWLFDQPALRSSLDAEQRWRYRTATRLARHYCVRLPTSRRPEQRHRTLRDFYRLAGAQKIQRIRRLTH